MLNLKRIYENQLDLFSWKPKEIDIPKSSSKKEPEQYDGLSDKDQSKWFTESFFKKKYDEYNRRFFSNQLPSDLPILKGRKASKTIGQCKFEGLRSKDYIRVIQLALMDYKYESRFYLEDTLLHEMCHVYQIEILCKNKLSLYKKDSKQGSGSSGHGPLFFEAANLVNNSPENIEGFKITQYEEGGHIESKRNTTMKLDGWFKCEPTLYYVSLGCIANTPNGKQNLVDSNPINIYTYANVETKKKLQDGFGRKINIFGYDNRAVQDVLKMIQDGDLIPVREPNKQVELFIGKRKELFDHKDSGKYQFVATTYPNTKSFYDDIEDVEMKNPYSLLKDRIGEQKMNLFSGLAFQFLNKAVDCGVYDMPEDLEDFIHNESKNKDVSIFENKSLEKDIQEDIEELEDVQNVVDIDQYPDGTFEVTIC